MGENPYYEYFKFSLQSNDPEQDGGKFYNSSIGHIYAAPNFPRQGRGLAGPLYSWKGRGIGSFFSRMFQWSQPLLKKLGQKVIDSATNVTANVVSDAIQGENILESAKRHGIMEGKQLLSDVPQTVGNHILNKSRTSSSPTLSAAPDFGKATVSKSRSSNSRSATVAKNATRASSKRKFTGKTTGRGKVHKKQRGDYISPQYPALQFMKE